MRLKLKSEAAKIIHGMNVAAKLAGRIAADAAFSAFAKKNSANVLCIGKV